jgi:arylsulfatase A-like enzyme
VLPKDTAALVLSDHGGHETRHGEDCDEDMLIPFIASGPGIPNGKTLDGQVSIVDVAPTVVQLLGLETPKEWRGTALDLLR